MELSKKELQIISKSLDNSLAMLINMIGILETRGKANELNKDWVEASVKRDDTQNLYDKITKLEMGE